MPNNSLTTTIDQTPFSNSKNSLPAHDVLAITAQSASSKVQDIISIGSRYHIIYNF